MFKPDYTLIGSFPQVEVFRDTLPELLVRGGEDEMERRVIEVCAQHFYGIDPSNFDNIKDLISAVVQADYELEHA